MKIYCKFALTLGCFALFSRVASAQLPALSINPVETELQRVTILGYKSQVDVTGAPYSAIEESLYSQRQPDGTYEDRSSTTTHIERDTQGRTRAERYMTSLLPGAGKPWLKSVFIADPMAGVLYCLDPTNHRASRAPWNPNTRALLDDASTMGHVASTRELQAHATTELLGVDTIEGLTVEGTRQTLTVPAMTMTAPSKSSSKPGFRQS